MDLKRHMAAYPVPWIALGVSILMLAGAHAFENFGGLEPCPLCLRQREAHWVAAGISLVILAATWREALQPWRLALMVGLVAAYVVSTGIAGYHVGVEQKWWDAPTSCATNTADTISLSDMLERLQHRAATPSCDNIPWSFLGLSMAAYNMLFSLGLAALAAFAFRPYLPLYRPGKDAPST
jgi:disulfide bond formation protein DsbB